VACFASSFAEPPSTLRGPFDEALAGPEDYDLWPRLAHRFPILFVPGAVGIYRPTAGGLIGTSVAKGIDPARVRYLAEKRLALLPDTPVNAALRQAVSARTEAWIVTELPLGQEPEQTLAQMMEAVRRCPAILTKWDVRDHLVSAICRCALASRAPLSRTRLAIGSLRAVGASIEPSPADRRLLARVWGEIAVGLLRQSPMHWPDACAAAAQAVRYDPYRVVVAATRPGPKRFRRGAAAAKARSDAP
jgi:hypothetical protein